MAAHEDATAPARLERQEQLDAKASRLLTAAQRAAEAAKRACAVGMEATQAQMRQLSDVVLDNAQRAKGSSTDFLSSVYVKAGDFAGKAQHKAGYFAGKAQVKAGYYAGRAQETAGHYAGRAQERALAYKGNVSRAIQQSRDGDQGEKLGFPLSIMVWCSTFCGGSKKRPDGDGAAMISREMQENQSFLQQAADEEEKGAGPDDEQFSSEFLSTTADEYATALEEAAEKLEEAMAKAMANKLNENEDEAQVQADAASA